MIDSFSKNDVKAMTASSSKAPPSFVLPPLAPKATQLKLPVRSDSFEKGQTINDALVRHHTKRDSHSIGNPSISAPTETSKLQSSEIIVSADPSTSKKGTNKRRSIGGSHFLEGFNVEKCSDILSIPDPPTPQPRNRRRLSSPVVRSLDDVTNQTMDNVADENTWKGTPTSGTSTTMLANNKRSRKSLCHVPSPVLADDAQSHSPPQLQSEEDQHDGQAQNAQKPLVPNEAIQVKICVGDDDEQQHRTSVRRRRKRKSMELPTDLVNKHAATFVSQRHPPSGRRTMRNEGSSKQYANLKRASDEKTMTDIQALIRGYCSLPLEERENSAEVKAMEQLSDYPLRVPPSPIQHRQDDQDPVSRFDNRRLLVQKMAPAIQEMDKRRIEETEMLENETQCRVEKSRSGKFRYYSIATNTKVSTNEYKRRYMNVIYKSKEDNSVRTLEWINRWKTWVDNRAGQDDKDEGLVSNKEASGEDCCLEGTNFFKENTSPNPSRPAPCNEHDDIIHNSTHKDDKNSKNLQQRPLSVHNYTSAERKSSKNDGRTEDATGDSTSTIQSSQALTCSMAAAEETCAVAAECEKTSRAALKSRDLLLPMPSREVESDDPDIARAEHKLWDAIDVALEEYSKAVFAIMETKHTSKKRKLLLTSESATTVT